MSPFELNPLKVPPIPKKFTHVFERDKEYLWVLSEIKILYSLFSISGFMHNFAVLVMWYICHLIILTIDIVNIHMRSACILPPLIVKVQLWFYTFRLPKNYTWSEFVYILQVYFACDENMW